MRTKDKAPVYCEIDFLKSFHSLRGRGTRKQLKAWGDALDFICQSHLVLNITKEQFISYSDEINTINDSSFASSN